MIKYIKEKAPQGDNRAILLSKKFRMDLIQIPEEFKDLPIEDFDHKAGKTKRKIILTRSNADIRNYTAWRVYDRQLITGDTGKIPCQKVLTISPALLVKTFGKPLPTRTGF